MAILRGVEDKSIDFLWTQVVNIIQSAPNNTHWIEACRRPDAFVVVSDIYPTFSARCADLILPVAGHFEKWGLYGNAERRTQGWHQLVQAPGEARTDVWTLMELAKRFTIGETWCEQTLKAFPATNYQMFWIRPLNWVTSPQIPFLTSYLPQLANVLKLCGRIHSIRMSSTLLVMH